MDSHYYLLKPQSAISFGVGGGQPSAPPQSRRVQQKKGRLRDSRRPFSQLTEKL